MIKADQLDGFSHRDLINSLKDKLKSEKATDKKSKIKRVSTSFYSGNGSMDDNLKLINQYICSCGSKTDTLMHSFQSDLVGRALDSYHLNCNSCGEEKKLSFHMMMNSIKKTSHVPIVIKKSKLYPFL
ncbi:MAG: hypothetical protein HeimC2_19930 [Candidatus Heimdallarchaeota archaeon LC_2]|nr:MAG: hypothetical protein HeimC2_19930 [Candidatus Heimdallarchaeota archaeon LC_2]